MPNWRHPLGNGPAVGGSKMRGYWSKVAYENQCNPENLAVDPLNLSQDEPKITSHRPREVLLK